MPERKVLMYNAEPRPDQRAVWPCLQTGMRVAEQAELDLNSVITSRDIAALGTKDSLGVESVSEGFQTW